MSKRIVIIGGGVSGLALLHYAKQKYTQRDDVEIVLLEKNDHLGGTIQSLKRQGCLFETGPNGFLDSKPRTLEFVKELGLEDSLIRANQESKIRYISTNGRLHALPTDPKSFLFCSLLNPLEKCRILGEVFVPRGNDGQESVYDFGRRRLGEKFAEVFLDPMVSGVYGGDAQKTVLKSAFPRIYQLEQEHGSLFKAMIKMRKTKKGAMGSPTGTLTTFPGGVSQLVEAVGKRYKDTIHLNCRVESITRTQNQYAVSCADGQQFMADALFISAPAYAAGPLLKDISGNLSEELKKINYAPMAVLGLVIPLKCFDTKPKGYGYLIPSTDQKEILGVLFESNIFPGRCGNDQVLLRLMMGGSRHSYILNKTEEELVDLALDEIQSSMDVTIDNYEAPFFIRFKKAIPQYDDVYCEIFKNINEELLQHSNLHLVANYLKGVSLNDCIENAYQAAS